MKDAQIISSCAPSSHLFNPASHLVLPLQLIKWNAKDYSSWAQPEGQSLPSVECRSSFPQNHQGNFLNHTGRQSLTQGHITSTHTQSTALQNLWQVQWLSPSLCIWAIVVSEWKSPQHFPCLCLPNTREFLQGWHQKQLNCLHTHLLQLGMLHEGGSPSLGLERQHSNSWSLQL